MTTTTTTHRHAPPDRLIGRSYLNGLMTQSGTDPADPQPTARILGEQKKGSEVNRFTLHTDQTNNRYITI